MTANFAVDSDGIVTKLTVTAQRAVALQPVDEDALECLSEDIFREIGLQHFREMGKVLDHTLAWKVIPRYKIDGMVMPWDWTFDDGTVMRLPDTTVMLRYEAYVVPNAEYM
ncbi:hypothetical protein SEA_SORORFAGO_47 [Mycobacterium phage SororFago]|nr:hypothetical protein SEA_SORORFAGO_47 [Mycobacterium phage SororFago]